VLITPASLLLAMTGAALSSHPLTEVAGRIALLPLFAPFLWLPMREFLHECLRNCLMLFQIPPTHSFSILLLPTMLTSCVASSLLCISLLLSLMLQLEVLPTQHHPLPLSPALLHSCWPCDPAGPSVTPCSPGKLVHRKESGVLWQGWASEHSRHVSQPTASRGEGVSKS